MHPIDARNREFYERVAERFSETRSRPWSGWAEMDVPEGSVLRVLDAGCGNGRLFAHLRGRCSGRLDYVGVDFSPALLDHARRMTTALGQPEDTLAFHELDLHRLEDAGWAPFDRIYLFGVLHHVAERSRRERLLAQLGRGLVPGGQLWVTAWRFGEDSEPSGPRRAAVPPPAEAGAAWLSFDGRGQRYCVAVSVDEIDGYPDACDLIERRRFFADGRSGRSNLYLAYERP